MGFSRGSNYKYVYWYEAGRIDTVANTTGSAVTTGFNSGFVPCLGATGILGVIQAQSVGASTALHLAATASNPNQSLMSNERSVTGAIDTVTANSGYSWAAVVAANQTLHTNAANTATKTGLFSTVSGTNVITALDEAARRAVRLVSLRCPSDVATAGVYGAHASTGGAGPFPAASNVVVTAKSTSAYTLTTSVNAATTEASVSIDLLEKLGGPNWLMLRPAAVVTTTLTQPQHQYINHRYFRAAIFNATAGAACNNVRVLLGVCYDTEPTAYQLGIYPIDPCPTSTGPWEYSEVVNGGGVV